jgi:hypothetical protein
MLTTSRLRDAKRLILLEQQLNDHCAEISEISHALSSFLDSQNKVRHELRLVELRSELKVLWHEYIQLVRIRR